MSRVATMFGQGGRKSAAAARLSVLGRQSLARVMLPSVVAVSGIRPLANSVLVASGCVREVQLKPDGLGGRGAGGRVGRQVDGLGGGHGGFEDQEWGCRSGLSAAVEGLVHAIVLGTCHGGGAVRATDSPA